MLQKSRILQILGAKGEAVVAYREPSITQEMGYPRLSRRVKNMTNYFTIPGMHHCLIPELRSDLPKSVTIINTDTTHGASLQPLYSTQ